MKTLIIYDNEGYILSMQQGYPNPRKPQGVPFLDLEIPEGKQVKMTGGIGVDVSVEPHELILEDIPPSEISKLKKTIADLTEIVLSGGM